MSKETALSNLKSGLPIQPEYIKLGFTGLVELIKLAFQNRGMLRQRVTVLEGIVEAQAEMNASQEIKLNAVLEREGALEKRIDELENSLKFIRKVGNGN